VKFKYKLTLLLLTLVALIIPEKSLAFIPPNLIAQGIYYSTTSIVIFIGFMFSGFVVCIRYFKLFYKKKKKILLMAFFVFFLICLLTVNKISNIYKNKQILNKTLAASQCKTQEATYPTGYNRYAITLDGVTKSSKKVYFIDVREKEEYESYHFPNAINIRAPDINIEKIKEKLSLDDSRLNDSLIVLYCYTGNRSAPIAANIGLDNVKFFYSSNSDIINKKSSVIIEYANFINDKTFNNAKLLGPYRDRSEIGNRYLSASEIENLRLSKKAIVVDGTFNCSHPQLEKIIIPFLKEDDYNAKITKLINEGHDKKIIVLVNNEISTALILFSRLEKEYGINENQLKLGTWDDWINETKKSE